MVYVHVAVNTRTVLVMLGIVPPQGFEAILIEILYYKCTIVPKKIKRPWLA